VLDDWQAGLLFLPPGEYSRLTLLRVRRFALSRAGTVGRVIHHLAILSDSRVLKLKDSDVLQVFKRGVGLALSSILEIPHGLATFSCMFL